MPQNIINKISSIKSEDVVNFALNPNFTGVLLWIRNIFIIISLALLFGIIYFLFLSSWLKRMAIEDLSETLTRRPFGSKKSLKDWMKITARLKTGKEDEYKLALIEADNMLDDILFKMGYKGESIEDKLKQVTDGVLPNSEQLLEARKIRNNVVYDPDYSLREEEARRAMSVYEKALQDLEAF